MTTIIGILAGICTATAMLPQAVHTWKTRDTAGLSLLTYLVLFTGALLWIFYGFTAPSTPIAITNIFTAGSSGMIIILKLKGRE